MLVSVDRSFIFIHIPRTGGTSLRHALEPFCRSPRRTSWRRLMSHLPIPDRIDRAYLREHDKAWWARLKLGSDFDRAFSFAVVRNPYDYAVSVYEERVRSSGRRLFRNHIHADFERFMAYFANKHRYSRRDQSSWVCDFNGQLIVDRVMRFETLDSDFWAVAEMLDMPSAVTLPKLNATVRQHYRNYYTPLSKRRAESIFQRDLANFGYHF